MADVTMPYRALGRCGTRVSALGLGGWTTFGGTVTDTTLVRDILTAAFDAGITFFDIADAYAKGEAERVMGATLRELPRHRLVISSKLYWPMSDDPNDRGLSRKHIRESIEASLRRIGTDYLDLYFCHRYDAETPLEETARAMDDCVRQGKILYWGTSEWTGAQLRAAHAICDRRNLAAPQVEQPQFHLIERARVEAEIRPTAEMLGMGLVTWSPLASGLLTGKYDAGVPPDSRLSRIEWLREKVRTDANVERVRRLKPVADRLGVSRAQLAVAWAVAQRGIASVILGVTSVAQLRENLGALRVKITPEVAGQIDAIFPPAKSG